MMLPDDGGQAPGGRYFYSGGRQGRAIGHWPDLGLDGPGRAVVVPIPATFDSLLMATCGEYLGMVVVAYFSVGVGWPIE
jgi:hypothetical protein